MKKIFALASAIVTFSSLLSFNVNACTDFRITAKDGTILIARTMEFAQDMQSNVRNALRGRQFPSFTINGKPGLTWKGKYGYLYLDAMNQDMVVDGMNETGLSFEFLYLPDETQYQIAPAGKENQAIPYYELGHWVLSNFKTIDEVKAALQSIYVVSQNIPGLGQMVFPLHASIYDASGKGIAVEFVAGKMNVLDSIGVMTNSPTYDWQVTNLRNYVNLSPYVPQPVKSGNLVFSATGQGSGMVGLPGDASPPSRFTKMAVMLKSVYPVATAADALNVAEHAINNVDLPKGFARSVDNGQESSDYTQWGVFKDLTNKILYYRTYDNLTLRSIAMNKLDFSPTGQLFKMPLAIGNTGSVMDVTTQFTTSRMTETLTPVVPQPVMTIPAPVAPAAPSTTN